VKLIRSVEALEKRRAGRPAPGVPIGIVWTECDREPGPGEVCDVVVTAADAGLPECWFLRARPVRGARDKGDMLDADGRIVGRVVTARGGLVDVVRFETAE